MRSATIKRMMTDPDNTFAITDAIITLYLHRRYIHELSIDDASQLQAKLLDEQQLAAMMPGIMRRVIASEFAFNFAPQTPMPSWAVIKVPFGALYRLLQRDNNGGVA